MSIESVMPSNHLILCWPHIRWPKYWSFSFSISPSDEYSGLISFRRDWLDLLAVQGTLKSLSLVFPCGSAGKESACNVGDLGSIPGLERSPGGGKGHQLQYSGLENSMNYIVHGVAKSLTRLSDFHFTSGWIHTDFRLKREAKSKGGWGVLSRVGLWVTESNPAHASGFLGQLLRELAYSQPNIARFSRDFFVGFV